MTIDEPAAMKMLEAACKAAGTQKAFAKAAGVSPTFITLIFKGRKNISAKVARHLGLEKSVEMRSNVRTVTYWTVNGGARP